MGGGREKREIARDGGKRIWTGHEKKRLYGEARLRFTSPVGARWRSEPEAGSRWAIG